METFNATVIQSAVRPVVKPGSDDVDHEALARNVRHVADLVVKGARTYGSKVFVLPEFCIQGFELGVSTSTWLKASIRLDDPVLDPLREAARSAGVYVAGMAYEIIDEFPGRYFNTGFIIDPTGEIALRYRKLYSITGKTSPQDVYSQYCEHFGGPESLFPVLDTPYGRLGVLVCYDIHFPEVARCLALRGAELLLHVTSEGRGPEHIDEAGGGWSAARKARAWENNCYLLMANSGPNIESELPPNVCHGESQILDFAGRVMNRAAGTEECLITASIDIEALRRRRAGSRFSFLTELCSEAHAPIYASATGRPAGLFEDGPMGDIADGRATQQDAYVAMCDAGILVPPKTGED
jgi:predicted amidohydrolase